MKIEIENTEKIDIEKKNPLKQGLKLYSNCEFWAVFIELKRRIH